MTLIDRVRGKLKILSEVRLPFRNVSFSATGEDLIVADVFRRMRVEKPYYFDIGANHPIRGNNTYGFYRAGASGVCVEPQPTLCDQIRKARPRDLCLNVGVSARPSDPLTFFVFDNPALSTFSKEHADLLDRRGPYRILRTTTVPMVPVNDLFERRPLDRPFFVSLDCEGMDLDILRGIDFTRHRPSVLCVETARPSADASTTLGAKIEAFDELLTSHEYWPFANSYVNTIYVARERLRLEAS